MDRRRIGGQRKPRDPADRRRWALGGVGAGGLVVSHVQGLNVAALPEVEYERYQFIPESSAVATACRAMLTSLAHEMAEARGRKIQPVNEQRIRLSMGRNGFTGITSCSATAPVDFAE